MTKAELIKRLESLKDDEPVNFVLLTYSESRSWNWQLLNPAITHHTDKYPEVIALVTCPIHYDTLKEVTE